MRAPLHATVLDLFRHGDEIDIAILDLSVNRPHARRPRDALPPPRSHLDGRAAGDHRPASPTASAAIPASPGMFSATSPFTVPSPAGDRLVLLRTWHPIPP